MTSFPMTMRGCTQCDRMGSVIFPDGNTDAEFLFLGGSPHPEDLKHRAPFQDKSGHQFDEWLEMLKLRRDRVAITYAVKCHRPHEPKADEISTCTGAWLKQELDHFSKVKVIVPLGKLATQVILGKKTEVPKGLRFYWTQVRLGDREFHVLPLPKPSQRNGSDRLQMKEQIFPAMVEYLTREVPEEYGRASRGKHIPVLQPVGAPVRTVVETGATKTAVRPPCPHETCDYPKCVFGPSMVPGGSSGRPDCDQRFFEANK